MDAVKSLRSMMLPTIECQSLSKLMFGIHFTVVPVYEECVILVGTSVRCVVS